MSKKIAVLVIHGFGGGTWVNENVVNYLQFCCDFDTYAFTLPGHDQEVVRNTKYKDWIEGSIKQVDKLLTKYNTLYIIGHSMGGVIASYIASEYKQVKKLVLLAPAFQYSIFNQDKKNMRNIIIQKKEGIKKKSKETLYRNFFPRLIRIPIRTFLEFFKLIKEYKGIIKKVKCSTLILHGSNDEIVPLASSEYAFNSIISEDKYLTIIKGVKHRILLSDRKDEISEYIGYYLKGGLKWKKKKKLII